MSPSCYSIAFLGPPGSEVDKRVLQLSTHYAVPVLDLPAAFLKALSRQLLLHLRQEKRVALEEAIAGSGIKDTSPAKDAEDDALVQLLSLSSKSFLNASPEEGKQRWLSLQQETQQLLCQKALRSILHPMMGPAFIQAGLFANPLLDAESAPVEGEEAEASIDIGELMDKSGRLPDCVVIFLCSDNVAVSRCLDLEKIDREAEEAKRRREAERRQLRENNVGLA